MLVWGALSSKWICYQRVTNDHNVSMMKRDCHQTCSTLYWLTLVIMQSNEQDTWRRNMCVDDRRSTYWFSVLNCRMRHLPVIMQHVRLLNDNRWTVQHRSFVDHTATQTKWNHHKKRSDSDGGAWTGQSNWVMKSSSSWWPARWVHEATCCCRPWFSMIV